MKVDRRDIFKFAGGAAAGVMFTPLPWKLLDDSAIWSQNWNWVPRPLKGEIKTKFSTCTLCPAGCGVKLRCVGEQPVSLAGVREHPNSRGALCPGRPGRPSSRLSPGAIEAGAMQRSAVHSGRGGVGSE